MSIVYNRELTAIMLLIKIANHGYLAYNDWGDGDNCNYCFFCNERQPELDDIEKHKEDCLYAQVRNFTKGIGLEVINEQSG